MQEKSPVLKAAAFFEGTEKKLELIVRPGAASLRSLSHGFWRELVQSAKADILSHIANEHCDAYLLSESSLFVWHDRILMLTCGNSRLIDAACFLLSNLNAQLQLLGDESSTTVTPINSLTSNVEQDAIAFFCYQRKNEYQAELQSSTFAEDIARLRQLISGKAMRLGHLDSHHHYLFYSDRAYQAAKEDNTCELLMYHIGGELAQYVGSDGQDLNELKTKLKLATLFTQFELDCHLFEPHGFSMNGLWQQYYISVHITPQTVLYDASVNSSAYVSFETNLDLQQYPNLLADILQLFAPVSWDLIGFNCKVATNAFPAHLCVGTASLTSEQGYTILFSHYQQLQTEVFVPELM